jgi:Ca-activated chloride channel family protein
MLLVAGCGGKSDGGADGLGDPGNCTVVDMAVSSEKIDLMTDLAKSFNGSDDAKISGIDGGCAFVRPYSKASGGVTDLLAQGWTDETEGVRPVLWSPASTVWGKILTQRLADQGEKAVTTANPVSFQLTPLTIAMPKPMATALGWPNKAIGWKDLADLATSKEGWAKYGHPEWGAFKLGKTNPNISTSGLSSLIGQAYATTGKTRGLTTEDLDRPAVEAFAQQIESSVVHYGDITQTFLNNWYRTDQAGTSLRYASAVAVEEKSVIDYNTGNPDGKLDPGEVPRRPRIPLVAIYPKEGTVYSDNPLYVLDEPWVSSSEKTAAEAFIKVVQRPENQKKILSFGFRPGNPDVALGAPITSANGVDPKQPKKLLTVPEPKVLLKLLSKWREQRKGARVLIVLDVSGSMSEDADPDDDSSDTKLDLAERAAVESLDEFKADDEVGLRVFSTNLGPNGDQDVLDLLPIRPMRENRESMKSMIQSQVPQNGTPLYSATQQAFDDMARSYDPQRINAVVLLTDGQNDDNDQIPDSEQLNQLLTTLRRSTANENAKPIRVFTIGYGKQADLDTLNRIAEATNAAAYDASNPSTITKVFTNVVSNF